MFTFQRVRGFLFYLSLFLFFGGLPLILSFALGYKFNPHTFKFVKTGLIYVKTQPEGASIYLNNKLIPEKSPASIQELVPGAYKVKLELAQHYPWKGEISVEEGKVSRMDKVILFPLRPDLEQLNQEKFSSFRLDAEKGVIYYLNRENGVVYRSNIDGSNFEDIASLPENFGGIRGWEVALDKAKLFIFNPRQIAVLFFDARDNYEYSDSPVILDYPQEKIIQVFWHSDSYHLIVVTNKHIGVIESRPRALPVNLVELSKESTVSYYDSKRDTLYFSDSQKSPDGVVYNNLYRLELNTDLYLLERLMKKKPNE
ncbi:MAG: PEGA domain-containing protein [Candidatus Omnitrophota bacterium]